MLKDKFKCCQCGEEFERYKSLVRNPDNIFCSRTCHSESLVGRKLSKETKLKMSNIRKKIIPKGAYSWAWSGGKRNCNGYCYVWKPEHPNANNRGCVLEHRLIMEKMLGRYLDLNERVHHINGNKKDNRPENLILFENESEHQIYHKNLGKDKVNAYG